jgi:hypothetical protein
VAFALAFGGCSPFDESLLGPKSSPLSSRQALPDAGRSAGSGTPDAGMGDAANEAGAPDAAVSGHFDAGHGQPPLRDAAIDVGLGDDAGQERDAGSPQVCEPTAVGDFCTQLPALPAAPAIDGVLDCGPTLLALDPKGWNGASAIPAGHVTKLAAAVRSDGLYVYVEVHGQQPVLHPAGSAIYCGDAVELYIDADGVLDAAGHYSSPGTMQFIVAAPADASATIEAMRYIEGNDHGAWTSGNVKTALLSDGYAIEAFITAADLDLTAWSPTTKVGLDIAIDVSAPVGTANLRCGQQLGQYFLSLYGQADSCSGQPWCDARAFCTPAL